MGLNKDIQSSIFLLISESILSICFVFFQNITNLEDLGFHFLKSKYNLVELYYMKGSNPETSRISCQMGNSWKLSPTDASHGLS